MTQIRTLKKKRSRFGNSPVAQLRARYRHYIAWALLGTAFFLYFTGGNFQNFAGQSSQTFSNDEFGLKRRLSKADPSKKDEFGLMRQGAIKEMSLVGVVIKDTLEQA